MAGHNSENDVTLERLQDQIEWYDEKSNFNQTRFKFLKIAGILAAALITVAAMTEGLAALAAALGVFIVIVEGLQQLNQYHANWIAYRSTCESLKHEKYLYLAQAGSYATAADAHALLAERIESLVSQEHAKWASGQEQSQKTKKD